LLHLHVNATVCLPFLNALNATSDGLWLILSVLERA
jgi:hypothetical protein